MTLNPLHIHEFVRIYSGLAELPREKNKEKKGVWVDVYRCSCKKERDVLWSRNRIYSWKKKHGLLA